MRILVVTNSQAFYKINLYEQLAQFCNVTLIDTGDKRIQRNLDFSGSSTDVRVIKASGSLFSFTYALYKSRKKYDRVLIGGWENLRIVISYFIFPQAKMVSFIESSVNESRSNGLLYKLKRILLCRTSTALCSGELQRKLVEKIGYKGRVLISGGVGIINKPSFKVDIRKNCGHFVYIGRLAKSKNVEILIEAFKMRPSLSLLIVGDGELDLSLPENVELLGYMNNNKLIDVLSKSSCLILPSLNEPWGLVVEEALYHGLAVILSNRVGCLGSIGTIPDECVFNPRSLKEIIMSIDYMSLESNLLSFIENYDRSYENHVNEQVDAYMKLIK